MGKGGECAYVVLITSSRQSPIPLQFIIQFLKLYVIECIFMSFVKVLFLYERDKASYVPSLDSFL